ncbi:hypothetical protein PVK06_040079 [Gossypium arboreum]|uniref:Uncharacterized protein n=1 Tax=Gossypium arboreum TaxID=29729 RepID=A0ABR0N594_GOSAR|nr:hypothetical protein PVK06_040079 [Gossypium arboreum]
MPEEELVLEFYANLTILDANEVLVRKKKCCITRHGLERLVKNVELLNQIEPNDPEYDESSTKFEPKANSVNEMEESEVEEKSNNPEIKVEPNVVELMEPSVNLVLTIPVPTSSNTMKKWEFSTMIDMWTFIHNQQQAYWRYAKIKDDSIENTFKNISNRFVPEFPDHIFETW